MRSGRLLLAGWQAVVGWTLAGTTQRTAVPGGDLQPDRVEADVRTVGSRRIGTSP